MFESYFVGENISEDIFYLNSSLRKETKIFFEEKFKLSIERYTPWLCYAPVLDKIPDDLVYHEYNENIPLISDISFISNLSSFMLSDGSMALDELFGDNVLWTPNKERKITNYVESRDLILNSSNSINKLFNNIIDFIVPLGGNTNRGYSTHYARGSIFRSFPECSNENDMAFFIVHELGHNVLMLWQSIDPILSSNHMSPVFSQIRRTNRPAIQSFHAAFVLSYMLFLEKKTSKIPEMKDAALRQGKAVNGTLESALILAIDSIKKQCSMTELGNQIIGEMENIIDYK